MGEGYGCGNFHFTHSALAIKFIQLQASPIVMSSQYSKDRSQGERTTVHIVWLPCMLYIC